MQSNPYNLGCYDDNADELQTLFVAMEILSLHTRDSVYWQLSAKCGDLRRMGVQNWTIVATAVSYTHLDVYKRQKYMCSIGLTLINSALITYCCDHGSM